MRNRQHFDLELIALQDELLRIGTMVEAALTQAMQAVATHDCDLAAAVVQNDASINLAVNKLHSHSLEVIARQQPLAGDLRTISVVLSLLPELERMGDHAATICKLQRRMMADPGFAPLEALPESFRTPLVEMGERTLNILHCGLDALRQRERVFAEKVVQMDDEIDHLYAKVFRESIEMARANPQLADEAIHLLTLAHNLERIGDRVTNIAEQIVFLTTGEIVELNY